ncbi:hypothetical protein BDN72DRAFT_893522 [Pluteus cervinus]|uniref:Uncharacterized protein n=1 Tax=Pluteus cervinus TaxID=181527 RepID=A0ACD3B7U1_9AGAR|nr:hypothetical protein BDN72DRAFT_893522 [Pluteus cervinus]
MDSPGPTAEDIAITLGIIPGTSVFLSKPHETEGERLADIRACVPIWHLQARSSSSYEKKISVLSEFCAKYLPTVMNRWVVGIILPTPGDGIQAYHGLVNGYFWVLYSARHLAYLEKYLGSKKPIAAPGKKFVSLLAQRIIRFGTANRHIPIRADVLEPVHWALELLKTGMMSLSSMRLEPGKTLGMPGDVVAELLPYLYTWQNQRTYEPLANESRVLYYLFTNGIERYDLLVRELKQVEKSLNICGLPGCEETKNLKTCAR